MPYSGLRRVRYHPLHPRQRKVGGDAHIAPPCEALSFRASARREASALGVHTGVGIRSPCLPLRGRWQREALTEGETKRGTFSPPVGYADSPLPEGALQRGAGALTGRRGRRPLRNDGGRTGSSVPAEKPSRGLRPRDGLLFLLYLLSSGRGRRYSCAFSSPLSTRRAPCASASSSSSPG